MKHKLFKRAIAVLVSTAFVIQSVPMTAMADSYSGPALIKTAGYQDFPAYYENSHHLGKQVTHPDVVVLDEAWNGYRYWAVYTPNMTRTSAYENPSIVASDDGVHWVEPQGIRNPIEPEPSSTRYHNCDADMLYNAKMNAMMAYWNWADDQAGGVGAEIRLRVSYDGVHWGVPVTYDSETGVWSEPADETERRVSSGDHDYITVVKSTDRYDMLSPTFLYDDFRDIFVMWANNAGNVGYNNGQNNYVRMWYSEDGLNWGDPVRVNNFLNVDASGRKLAPWHQDVQYIPELKEFWCVSQCFTGGSPDGSVLHLTKSKDGLNWEQTGTSAILSPGSAGSWDDFQIYRSSLYYEPAEGGAPGSGKMRVWYSALQKDTLNKKVIDPQGNLTLQTKDQDDKIWRIGYAENDYINVMKALTNRSDYTVPALVSGESLTVTSDASGAIAVGEKAKLSVTFSPANTSDQVVRFTSDRPDIAAVDAYGVVTALKEGSARITGETREGVSGYVDVTTVYVPVTGLTLNVPETLTLYEGETKQLTAQIRPENASDKRVTWSTSDESVASVSADGLLTVLGGGTAVITATAADGITARASLTAIANPSELLPQSGLTATATSVYGGTTEGPAANVLDGDKNTIWHTKYNPKDALPQSLTVNLGGAKKVNKYVYTPRQVGTNGMVTQYELYAVKEDNSKEKIAFGEWPVNTSDKTVVFRPVEAKAVELKVLNGSGGFGTAAEINIYEYAGTENSEAQSVQLSAQNISLAVGGTAAISAVVLPETAGQGIVWTSGNPGVVTVENGTLTGVSEGEAVITAASAQSPSVKAECRVNVHVAGVRKLEGNGFSVVYNDTDNRITLYRVEEDGTEIKMSRSSEMGYPVIDGAALKDFTNFTCTVESGIEGLLGAGSRMTVTSESAGTGLKRIYVMEISDKEGTIYTKTSYQAGGQDTAIEKFVDNEFEIAEPDRTIWSYNGGGEGGQSTYDTLQRINLTDSTKFYRENIQDFKGASIPVSDIYTAQGGILVGDASAARREVRTPVEETGNSAKVSIQWPGKTLRANTTEEIGQSFVNVHRSDYYMGLRGYSDAIALLGVKMLEQSEIPDSSYDLRWESWGWEFNWTIDLIIGKLDQLQAAGVKQITLDDGWYNNAGEWGLNTGKFPNGASDMKRLTDAIHERGMTAILWWRPCDGGREASKLYREHPEYFVKNENGSFAKLAGPGSFNSFNGSTGYALCPLSEGAIQSQKEFIDRAMNEWGFDGFKGDYVWGMPKCYNLAHNHSRPEESTEHQADFYRTAREAMVLNDPDCFTLLCNCGVPQDLYALPYVTQIATADPTSVSQTRRRVKAYKALAGDYYPVTTDHNNVWYPSTIGTGAVMIEKRAFNEAQQAEYEKWLAIANDVQLQRGRFIGDLYNYGFDPYETYVVEKDQVMYYAFYKDGIYKPSGSPQIVLKGLDPEKMYRIVDYVNNKTVATNLMGDEAAFSYDFSNYLLVKAVEINTPDEEVPDQNYTFTSVDALSSDIVYTGAWHDDHNDAFYEKNARYTNAQDASAEFTFVGTGVQWYGQHDTNFGTAEVYVDGALKETVDCNGAMAFQQKNYEILGLPYGEHTIKIVRKTKVIDIDRFAYTQDIPESAYESVDQTSDLLKYVGTWSNDNNDAFYNGSAKYTRQAGASVEFSFTGTAVRWYGQHDTNFGSAEVSIDGEVLETVNCKGSAETQIKLFEAAGLEDGLHTIRIECKTPVIDIDRFTYVPGTAEETVYKGDLESLVEVAESYQMNEFKDGNYKDQFQISLGRANNLVISDTATQDSVDEETTYLLNAMLELRRTENEDGEVDVDVLIPASGERTGRTILEKVIRYTEKTKVQNKVEHLNEQARSLWDEKLEAATAVQEDGGASQDEIQTAWAELLNMIQHLDYSYRVATSAEAAKKTEPTPVKKDEAQKEADGAQKKEETDKKDAEDVVELPSDQEGKLPEELPEGGTQGKENGTVPEEGKEEGTDVPAQEEQTLPPAEQKGDDSGPEESEIITGEENSSSLQAPEKEQSLEEGAHFDPDGQSAVEETNP